MNCTIFNDCVTAIIDSVAAQIISFRKNDDEKEYVWCRDPAYWAFCNPILFPMVSKPAGGEYSVKGKTFPMSNHGFCRRADFRFTEMEKDRCVLVFEGNEESATMYPFKFKMTVTYWLEGLRLNIRVEVDNRDPEELPFMLGFHPAFNCPSTFEEGYQNCYFLFDRTEDLPEGKTDRLYFKDIFSSDHLSHFYHNDTVKSDTVTMVIDEKEVIRVGKKGFTTIGFWRKPDFPFVCIEPWFYRNDLKKAHTFTIENENNMLDVDGHFENSYWWEICD